jgi:hypothetical protein
MIYKDGYHMDDNLKVTECPVCANEEFSNDAEYCRICGTRLYNYCQGYYDDWYQKQIQHKNPGNARFCETCGKPTYFGIKKFLSDWKEAKTKLEEGFYPDSMDEEESFQETSVEIAATKEDDELPF